MTKKSIRVLLSSLLIICLIIGLRPITVSAGITCLNKSKATIYLDRTLKLTLQNASGKITWSSSDPKVAKVNSKGKVTPKKKGTAVITAKYNGIKYKCKVTVKKPKLNIKEVTLFKGETVQLKLTGATLETAVTGDEYVATVDEQGLITAAYAGTTQITVSSAEGRTFKCKVTVNIREAEDHKHIASIQDGREPSCTEPGFTEGKFCAVCHEIMVPHREIPATGHNFVNDYCTICGSPSENIHIHSILTLEAVEPTCTTSGLTEGIYCETCEAVFKRQTTIPALGHKLNSGTCTVCGKHIHEAYVVKAVPVTCFTDGSTQWSFCKWCGEVLIPEQKIKAPGSHEYGDNGLCIRCSADRTGHVHKWVIENAVKATCEEVGYTEGKYCETCLYREKYPSFIPPTGHVYKNGKCKFCGKEEPK